MGLWERLFGKDKEQTTIETGQVQGYVGAKRVDSVTINIEGPAAQSMEKREAGSNKLVEARHRKIDKHIIVDFDLEDMEEDFRSALRAKIGAFGFSLDVPCQEICKQYILERLALRLERKCDRPVHQTSLYLKNEDLDSPTDVLDRLANKLGDAIPKWFEERAPEALMVSIWNYDGLPASDTARACWEKILTDYNAPLKKQAQTLVVIWISLNGRAIELDADRFRSLRLPPKFESIELETHFRQRLKGAQLDDDAILHAIQEILAYGGKILPTYAQMKEIIDELKGGPSPYAY